MVEETLSNLRTIFSRIESNEQLSKVLQRSLLKAAEDFYLDHFVAEMKTTLDSLEHESVLAYRSRLSRLSEDRRNQL